MFIGARVIVKSLKKPNTGFFGIVIGNTGTSLSTILLDDASTISARPDRIMLVDYFVNKSSAIAMDKVAVIKENMTAQEFFLRPKAVVFDETLPKCVWYWLNKTLFNNELTMPKISVGVNLRAKAKLAGVIPDAGGIYVPKSKKSPESQILIHKNVTTMKRVSETTAHEMIHQVNYEIDAPAGKFRFGVDDTHGKKFFSYEPLLKTIGIPLTKMMDKDWEATVDEKFNTKIKKYWILMNNKGKDENGKPIVFAGKFSSLDAAVQRYQSLRLNSVSGTIYSSTNAELYHALPKPHSISLFQAEPAVIEQILKFSTKE